MKGDHMGTDPAHPRPQELSLSNWTWFRKPALPTFAARLVSAPINHRERNSACRGPDGAPVDIPEFQPPTAARSPGASSREHLIGPAIVDVLSDKVGLMRPGCGWLD